MRVITSIRAACCLALLAVPALPAGAAQLDSGTGVQASREVETVPPASNSRPAATARNRTSRVQAAKPGARTPPGSSRGKTTPP